MGLEVTARWATISDLQLLERSNPMHLPEAKLRRKIEWQEAVVASVDEVLVGYLYLDTIWSSVPFIALIWVLEGQRQSQASSILNSKAQLASSILVPEPAPMNQRT